MKQIGIISTALMISAGASLITYLLCNNSWVNGYITGCAWGISNWILNDIYKK